MIRMLTILIVTLALISMAIYIMAFDPLSVSIVITILLVAWIFAQIIMLSNLYNSTLRVKIVILISLTIIVSSIITHWPLRLAFAVMSQEFNHIAVQIEQGIVPDAPFRIGSFIICESGSDKYGNIYLWTTRRSYGSVGFVKCQDESLETNFNVFYAIKLANGWHMIVED